VENGTILQQGILEKLRRNKEESIGHIYDLKKRKESHGAEKYIKQRTV